MIPELPAYINIVFVLTVLLTLWFFWKATNSLVVLIISIGWLLIHGILAYKGFYQNTHTLPPRLLLATLPPLISMIIVLVIPAGKKFVSRIRLKTLLLMSVVRIPVEVCLYWLFLNKAVPEVITFSGSNLDMISGITAPIVAAVCFRRRSFQNRNLLFAWNIIALVLLLSVVVNAILSVPSSFQRLSFDQPNIAVLYFPFIWLPGFIVMVVLFSHFVMIKRLLMK